MQPAFATTVHDPDGRLLAALSEHLERLAGYDGVFLRCTSVTSPALIRRLEGIGEVVVDHPGRIGRSRREALRAARASGATSFFYCDFDRWLHWAGTYPDELARLPQTIEQRVPRALYVCLGRTERAFATHPCVQRTTEGITNRAVSRLLGRTLDATAGACWLTRDGADVVLSDSIERTNATDLEWPSLVASRYPDRLGHIEVEGLEFETATFYPREITAAGGRDAWIRATYNGRDIWAARTDLMYESVSAAVRVFRSYCTNSDA